ncbi:uncharacterized protein [Nicotiana sylvestris]|uniref:uncharacterized protein n=1 Tax=Nicotiana sylvestris TaxID=4096 RepID=UPI00388C469A
MASLLFTFEKEEQFRVDSGMPIRVERSKKREENVEEDELANLRSSMKIKGTDSSAVVQLLHSVLDVDDYYKVNSTNVIWDWRNELIKYLRHDKLPEDQKASWALWTKEARYCLVGSQLYRRSFQGPLAWCLGTLVADYVMREVHEEVCENHTDVESFILKLIKVSYYWPRIE